MSAERAREHASGTRRIPTQQRSRRRVEGILDAAERLVVTQSVEELSTRAIAQSAEVPVASLYQYFADKEEVLLALIERDMAEMDEQLAVELTALDQLSAEAVVRAATEAFVTVYHRRPAFVEIYLRGRGNPAIAKFGRLHNVRIAATLREFLLAEGLCTEELSPTAVVLAVEIGDRMFQLAFESVDGGDPEIVEEGRRMLTAYLEFYATPLGLGR